MIGLTVYDWMEMSKEDFDKIRGKGRCVKCGKPTKFACNLCHGHHVAYHRWRNKMEKCPRCFSKNRELIDRCVIYDHYHICKNCGHCDFSHSKRLSKEENKERLRAVMLRLGQNEEEIRNVLEKME